MNATLADVSPWRRATLAAEVFALDPRGAGVIVRGGPGRVRDAWLAHLRAALPPGAPLKRIPAAIGEPCGGGLFIGNLEGDGLHLASV